MATPADDRVYFDSEGPVGLGGWLVLAILWILLALVLTSIGIGQVIFGWEGLKPIIAGSTSELAALRKPMLLSFLGGVAVILSAASSLFLIFAKRPGVVAVATVHFLAVLVASTVDVWADHKMHEIVPSYRLDSSSARGAMAALVAALIWIPYFHTSTRVRNTFLPRPSSMPGYAS